MNLKCPVCKRKEDIRLTHARGFLEKKLFPLILLRPYRCRMCRSRFFRFGRWDGLGKVQRAKQAEGKAQEQQFEQFLKPSDDREFRELIAEIAEAERRIFGDQPGDHADEPTDPSTEEQEEEVSLIEGAASPIQEDISLVEQELPPSEEELPLTLVQTTGSGRKFAWAWSLLPLIVAASWWYQTHQVTSDLQTGIPGESLAKQEPEGRLPIESGTASADVQILTSKEVAAEDQEALSQVDQIEDWATDLLQPAVKSQPARSPASKPSSAGASSGPPVLLQANRYTIQVGAFSAERAAQEVVVQLRAKGYSGRIEYPQTGAHRYYQVWVGEFDTTEAASQFQVRLKADGFQTYLKKIAGR
ncbi:SPOR domain-containing protein [Acidobacteria bacterium AH-259-D05]|nr:SPOR domain-containing protein [Acidobacteria bacterium AH-259-D05]